MNASVVRRVLNVGSGSKNPSRLHASFKGDDWQEIRLDIDEKVDPDIVGSITDMRDVVPDKVVDAVWSCHILEHLYEHDAPLALAEFRRILRPDGFALINCPDVAAIARLIIDDQFDTPAYMSAAGPITALDMLWGHSKSIAAGNHYMAHKTGFTTRRLGQPFIDRRICRSLEFFRRSLRHLGGRAHERRGSSAIRHLLVCGGIEFPK